MGTMHPAASLAIAWLLAALTQTGAWSWQRKHRNAGMVDVVWALSLGAAAVIVAALGDGGVLPRALLAVLGGAWGARLGLHLLHRVRGEPEDGRYAQLRARWQGDQRKWFAFFQAQALLVVLFALPFLAVARNPATHWTPWLIAGVVVFCGSVAGEALADAQLARFRADPANKGRTCRAGLWRYSRHPNYFFEWLHWCAYVLLAVGSPWQWLAWLGPVVMYGFLRYLSGVPFTEAQALRTRGEDYRAYMRETPMFFPWFPRSTP